MKTVSILSKACIALSWFSLPVTMVAQSSALVLKHGLYAQTGTSCKDAPNAALLSWDGIGLSGAHSSRCTSSVVRRHANRYKVSTACSALGDGTPNASGKPDATDLFLTRFSYTSFAVGEAKPLTNYRWCAAK